MKAAGEKCRGCHGRDADLAAARAEIERLRAALDEAFGAIALATNARRWDYAEDAQDILSAALHGARPDGSRDGEQGAHEQGGSDGRRQVQRLWRDT